MRYRTIRVDFWQDPEFSEWSFEEKAFYLYLISSPYTTLSGFVMLSTKHISADTNLSHEKVKKLLSLLEDRGKIRRAGPYIWIRNFVKYQNAAGIKIFTRILRELRELLTPITAPLVAEFMESYPVLQKVPGFDSFFQQLQNQLEQSPSPEKLSQDSQPPKPSRTPPVPYQKIIELYHELCSNLPRVQKLTESRKRLLRARWKEHPNLDFWKSYFQRVSASDFLNGRTEPPPGRSPFIADFEWLIKPSNFAKVLEGRYDNRKPKRGLEVDTILKEFNIEGAGKDE